MTEALAATVAVPEETETKGNKTKLITAAALGVVGVAGAYAESKGWVNGLPPPAHSLKHPWLGYYSAWGISKLTGRREAVVAGGVVSNIAAESIQDMTHATDHYPFHWAEIRNGHRTEDNIDNAVDLALCMGGTALFMAQSSGAGNWVRQRVSDLRDRFSPRPEPALNPVE